jgi:hypothetical protein
LPALDHEIAVGQDLGDDGSNGPFDELQGSRD